MASLCLSVRNWRLKLKMKRNDLLQTQVGRRALIAGAASALVFATIPAAFAVENQSEWRQDYEGTSAVQRSTTPILSPQTVAATEAAIARYRDLASRGGWQSVPEGQSMKIGVRGKNVVALRQRLSVTGDLDGNADASPVFDSYVEAGVKRFQARHGLAETGVVGEQTFAALNIPVDVRTRQLETNLVRLRSLSGNLGPRFVTVNIPAAHVETVENGVVATHHAAGVGKIDRQSPVMNTRALDINFNPYWTVPPSLIKKDLIPKMQANPDYLTEHKIRIFDPKGQEVPPTAINWNTTQATGYKYRQDPGGDINSLGFVRINIANPYGVYMHDTPEKGVFGDDFRFVSSGCVRVQNVRDYVAWLLKNEPGWNRDRVDQAMESGERLDVKITQPVNVYWVYVTGWATPDGVINFREDIYQRDGFGGAAPVANNAVYSKKPAASPGEALPVSSTEKLNTDLLAPMQDE